MSGVPANIEIGVSKACCWLCERYLQFLAVGKDTQFIVGKNQVKVHSGWSILRGTPHSVEIDVRRLVGRKILETRESVIQRCKSDSYPETDWDFVKEAEYGKGLVKQGMEKRQAPQVSQKRQDKCQINRRTRLILVPAPRTQAF